MTTQEQLVSDLKTTFGEAVNSTDIRSYCAQNGLTYRSVISLLKNYKTGSTTFNLGMPVSDNVDSIDDTDFSDSVGTTMNIFNQSLIPKKDSNYVPFGPFKDLTSIVKSNMFFPVFITGLSGNGKTVSVEQVCAKLNRELIRVNVSAETDQDDLVGGFRLDNGSTVWHNGPVVEAMERGAILLLDEIDLASSKIMVLQSVLEGKPLFLKKISKLVYPKAGFNIIATANTKGKGSGDGRFIGTNLMNEAFLDRFSVTLEQSYPTTEQETKILTKLANSIGLDDADDFIKRLVTWADDTRKTFLDGGIDELISTRRLTLVIRGYKIFNNKASAIKYAVQRFDPETRDAFITLYDKIDATYSREEEKARRQLENQDEEDSTPVADPSIKEIQIVPIDAPSVPSGNLPF
jgi:MoxR-like ATPase